MSDSRKPEKQSLGERLSLPWMCDICGKPRRKGSHEKCSRKRKKQMEGKAK